MTRINVIFGELSDSYDKLLTIIDEDDLSQFRDEVFLLEQKLIQFKNFICKVSIQQKKKGGQKIVYTGEDFAGLETVQNRFKSFFEKGIGEAIIDCSLEENVIKKARSKIKKPL